jgi:hypothetical protein
MAEIVGVVGEVKQRALDERPSPTVYLSARALGGLVVGTGYVDVLSLGIAAAVLMVAGVGAVLPAALRAARTDPLIALRAE